MIRQEILAIIGERESIPATRVEVAAEAAMPLSTLWRIEKGKCIPHIDTLGNIRSAIARLRERKQQPIAA